MLDPDLRARLLRFELALATRDASGIDGGLMSLIAPNFLEFGTSGRVWTHDSIREVLEGPPGPPASVAESRIGSRSSSLPMAWRSSPTAGRR